MSERDMAGEASSTVDHERAARAFLTRIESRFEDELDAVFLFGSTARGDATGLDSDVDVLVVLASDADSRSIGESLREIAYDVMLEHGPVVELHVMSRDEFAELRERGNPFVRNVVSEGRTYG